MNVEETLENCNTCRCCLSQSPSCINIFCTIDDINVADTIQYICAIEISHQDNLPQNICDCCVEILKTCHNFRVKAQQSEETLHNLLEGDIVVNEEESEEEIIFVDETPDDTSIEMDVEAIEASTSELTCPYCSKTFVHRRNLQIHKQRHFMVGKYGCPSCTQRFHTKFDLLRHTSTLHATEKPYPCDECGSRFPTNPELNRHKKVLHTPVKSFSCSECGMLFKLKANAKQHIQLVHAKERFHICEVCGKAFAFASKLKIHQKSSKCERPIGVSIVEDVNCLEPTK